MFHATEPATGIPERESVLRDWSPSHMRDADALTLTWWKAEGNGIDNKVHSGGRTCDSDACTVPGGRSLSQAWRHPEGRTELICRQCGQRLAAQRRKAQPAAEKVAAPATSHVSAPPVLPSTDPRPATSGQPAVPPAAVPSPTPSTAALEPPDEAVVRGVKRALTELTESLLSNHTGPNVEREADHEAADGLEVRATRTLVTHRRHQPRRVAICGRRLKSCVAD